MLKKHSQLFEALFSSLDLFAAACAWVMSYWLRFYSGWFPLEKGIPVFNEYLKILVFVAITWVFVFRRSGLYRPLRGYSRLGEVFKVVRANSLSVLILMSLTFLFWEKSVPLSRLVFLIFWALSTTLVVCNRAIIRMLLRTIRKRGYNLRYAVIVGSGALARQVAARIKSRSEFGIELIGCLERGEDTNPSVIKFASRTKLNFSTIGANALALDPIKAKNRTLPVIGVYEQLPMILASTTVDQVIIAMPLQDHDLLEGVIASIGDSMVDVKIVPDVHRFIQLGSAIEEFDGLPVVSLASTPLIGLGRMVKRITDIVLSSIFLLLYTPIMLIIALSVKLTSRGPVFFMQERVGLDGQSFNIYKFRTMSEDAESKGAKFAVRNDPRSTRLGKFLRRFSLDELPQLWNVFKGQMSLVGPRPERPVFIEEFRQRVPKYMLRHKVQAGMTGWAQVNGWRGNTSIQKRIEHDLYYIEHWSFMLDMKILWLTLLRTIADRNAY